MLGVDLASATHGPARDVRGLHGDLPAGRQARKRVAMPPVWNVRLDPICQGSGEMTIEFVWYPGVGEMHSW